MSFVSFARPLLKRILPRNFRQFILQIDIRRRDSQFFALERKQVFDAIYKDGMWSSGSNQQLSGFGSYGSHAEAYLEFVKTFIKANHVKSILDVGCGDFNIGSRLCDSVEQYVGADVSQVIIERNRSQFHQFSNVQFRVLDVCSDELPNVDLITIREVFQHLSNVDITSALANIERCGAKYVLLTEHLPSPEALRTPNLDKPTGPNIRHPFGSGVYIDQAPFNRKAEVVLTVEHPANTMPPSFLVTYLWEPGKQ